MSGRLTEEQLDAFEEHARTAQVRLPIILADRVELLVAEVRRLCQLRDAVLAHSMSPTVPHSPQWDDELEAIYKLAEDLRPND